MMCGPQAVAALAEPSVGIFWVVGSAQSPILLADLCAVDAGEVYGDFHTYGGHYEYWSTLAALGAGELRRRNLPTVPVWSEYEEWPRGRVIHHIPTGRFILYADRQLQHPATLGLIVCRFSLPAESFDVRSDGHYISTRNMRSR